ncbi:MAG: adenylosuccinate synthetase [Bacteroidales bacterium]|nr:adenylosuccinate synthetase [Bacteroidales bacterium]
MLAEGAQGSMLDVDFGTYPYVTSSNCSIGAFVPGLAFLPSWWETSLASSRLTPPELETGLSPLSSSM